MNEIERTLEKRISVVIVEKLQKLSEYFSKENYFLGLLSEFDGNYYLGYKWEERLNIHPDVVALGAFDDGYVNEENTSWLHAMQGGCRANHQDYFLHKKDADHSVIICVDNIKGTVYIIDPEDIPAEHISNLAGLWWADESNMGVISNVADSF